MDVHQTARPLYGLGDKARMVNLDDEPGESYRSPWRRDYSRVLHSAAFRRLQGKTQLFPGHESDFFRNRLTHSLEVAQVAKTIALRINAMNDYFCKNPIDLDIVETAGLAHDLGHPPFGHNGEQALDKCMHDNGGFEGNAQTLRILGKLVKRDTPSRKGYAVDKAGRDVRAGLNLTSRTLASILKYDTEIPHMAKYRKNHGNVFKGYYYTELDLVDWIKNKIGYTELAKNLGDTVPPFKTIECSIMDIADDIAYATYDIEDALKAEFITPNQTLTVLAGPNTAVLPGIIRDVTSKLDKEYPDSKPHHFEAKDVIEIITKIFLGGFQDSRQIIDLFMSATKDGTLSEIASLGLALSAVNRQFELIAKDSYYRTSFTSGLIRNFVNAVEVTVNDELPAISRAHLPISVFKEIEVIKSFTFNYITTSPMLKVTEHRGQDIVTKMFDAIAWNDGHMLLPEDFKELYERIKPASQKRRVICDFISGMTDRYAVQFYSRLLGSNAESIWSPL
jgi:dGTPase